MWFRVVEVVHDYWEVFAAEQECDNDVRAYRRTVCVSSCSKSFDSARQSAMLCCNAADSEDVIFNSRFVRYHMRSHVAFTHVPSHMCLHATALSPSTQLPELAQASSNTNHVLQQKSTSPQTATSPVFLTTESLTHQCSLLLLLPVLAMIVDAKLVRKKRKIIERDMG
jgi:hypothetical protein